MLNDKAFQGHAGVRSSLDSKAGVVFCPVRSPFVLC